MAKILSRSEGGHNYDYNQRGEGSIPFDGCGCLFGCGAWISLSGSYHSPQGIEEIGKCPKNPINKKEEGDKVKILKVEDLIGRPLDGFSVQWYTQVYVTDADGKLIEIVTHYKDDDIAKVFAGQQTYHESYKTKRVILLTDGEFGCLVGSSVTISNDEEETIKIKERALAKLSDEERRVLIKALGL